MEKIKNFSEFTNEERSSVLQEQDGLKLFVWKDNIFCDWTCGMAVAIAHDLESAMELVIKDHDVNYETDKEELKKVKPDIYPIAPIGFAVSGGG